MNLIKKILVVHGDIRTRRRYSLLLADAGFDIRSHCAADAALSQARSEWYDLALVDHEMPEAPGFALVGALRAIQPTLPVILIAGRLDLPLVVQAIRQGVADVLAAGEEPRQILRHARAVLRLDAAEGAAGADDITDAELAAVEGMLVSLSEGAAAAPGGSPAAEWLRISKEKALLEAQVDRLQRDKGALEAELKVLLGQHSEAGRCTDALASLRTERELIAATQAAIDAKARALAESRAALAGERASLEQERRRLAGAAPAAGTAAEKDLDREREEIAGWRKRLSAEEDRLAEETAALRRETVHLAQERRRWHEELDLFRDQEENLRVYEERLRRIQSTLEAERVALAGSRQSPPAAAFDGGDALRDAWAKLQRATEIFEAERANVCDDRLAAQEHEAMVRRREERVRDREIQLSLAERRLQALPPAPPPSQSRGPFSLARAVFGGAKKT